MPSVNNPLAGRTTAPPGYFPVERPTAPIARPVTSTMMPTPPNEAYTPSPTSRGALSGLVTAPDQLRQAYGRGVNLRRFWPLQS
jgi:hypothetical protein